MVLLALILSILIKSATPDCDLDNVSPNIEFHNKLYEYIQCNNIRSEPPNKNSTTVTVRFIIKKFYFDGNEELFNVYSWMFFFWDDPRVKWNPDEYDGIKEFYIHSLLIWTPLDIFQHMKEINDYGEVYYDTPHCQIKNTGRVLCIPRVIHTTNCNSELKNWPYDVQTCSFRFHIKKGKKENVTFTFNSTRGISALGAEYGSGWNIIDYETGENATGDTKLHLKFVVERQALGVVAMVIIPSIVVAVLVLSSIVLDVKNSNRLGLAVFSLLVNLYLLKVVGELIPHRGYDSPTILYLFHGSIYIIVCVICLFYILASLRGRQGTPDQWITNFNDYVLNNYIARVIYKWQPLSQTSTDEPSERDKWEDFTSIINTLFFLVILMAYLILFLIYLPQPTPSI